MAVVGPLRALFIGEAQSLHNRLRAEAGGAGMFGAAITALLLPLALGVPAFGCFVLGSSLGADLTHPARGLNALRFLSGFLITIPLALGFLAGIVGGDTESGLSLRGYPVTRRTRLAARLLSTSIELLPLLATACLAGVGLGLSVARPGFAPFALLLCLQSMVWIQIVVHLTRDVRALGLTRPIISLPLLAASFVAGLTQQGRPLLTTAGRLVGELLPYSPTMFGVMGFADLASGDVVIAALRQLLPLGVTVAAVEFTARRAARLEMEEGGARNGGPGREKLWTFGAPMFGVAKFFVSSLVSSRHGRTLLFIPPLIVGMIVFVSLVLPPNPRTTARIFTALSPSSLASLPLFGILPFLLVNANSEIWLNQWGWDGRALRSLFVAPIQLRDLLLGKLAGFGAVALAQLLMAAPILAMLRRPRAAELLWGLGAGVFAFFVITGLGHVLSAGLCRPLDEKGRINRTESFAAMIASAFASAAAVVPMLFTYAAFRGFGERGLAVAFWILAAAGAAAYRAALPFLALRVRDMREQFLEAS